MPYNTRGQSMLGTGALTPALVSPVAKFTFSNLTTSLTKPSHAKISLKRDSDEKKRKRVRFGGIFRSDLMFHPVVQMHNHHSWPSSLRLLSPLHLAAALLASLFLAICGLVLWPMGHAYLALLSLLASIIIFGSLLLLAASVFMKKRGASFDRLKLRA